MTTNTKEIWDRTTFVPPHTGPNIIPNTPMLSQILRHAMVPNRLAVRDLVTGVSKTYADLISDVVHLRNVVLSHLTPEVRTRLDEGEEVYIGVLAAGGYEYVVAFLAILALKGAIVPMSVMLPVEEASYFVKTSRQVLILHSTATKPLCTSLTSLLNRGNPRNPITGIEIGQHLSPFPLPPQEIILSSDGFLNDNAAGLVIFTSGTTGPPKGGVWSRGVVHEAGRSFADEYGISHTDTVLHILPVHHATGITITMTPFLVSGACIEFRSGSFDAEWIWKRWRDGDDLTYFSAVPTIYMRLMRYFVQYIQPLPNREEVAGYVRGANQFKGMLCGTSALPAPVQEFWQEMSNGKPMLTRYGGTEFGAVFTIPRWDEEVPIGSVGKPMVGIDVKLANGNEGEILIKSPLMFSKYLFDFEATKKSHDETGYFKTGDIGRKEGGNYFIMGRASIDIIKSGGYKISALDIERECLGLPYIEEVLCVGVEDEEFGQRVAAAVKLRADQDIYACGPSKEGKQLTIEDLRRDLRERLAGYKLPTILRVLDDEIPKTGTGKVQKKLLGPKLFPHSKWIDMPEIQVWRKDRIDIRAKL